MIGVGSRVRVELHKPDEWNAGAAAVASTNLLDGGTVVLMCRRRGGD